MMQAKLLIPSTDDGDIPVHNHVVCKRNVGPILYGNLWASLCLYEEQVKFYLKNPPANSPILATVWARKAGLEQAEYSRQIGPAILTHFEDYFNQSYPLPKLDMVALPVFRPGAMENWGLVLYRCGQITGWYWCVHVYEVLCL